MKIFEFAVDRMAPRINMQSNETGIVDTMQDLIVDSLGAVVVAAMGWAYMRAGRYSFIADGVRGFVERNPRLFRRPAAAAPSERSEEPQVDKTT